MTNSQKMLRVIKSKLFLIILGTLFTDVYSVGSLPSGYDSESTTPSPGIYSDGEPPGQGAMSRLPLTVTVISNIGKEHALLYTMESDDIIHVTFRLFCTKPEQAFTVFAETTNDHVAFVLEGNHFNVSCESAQVFLVSNGESRNVDTEMGPDSPAGLTPDYRMPDTVIAALGNQNVSAKRSPTIEDPVIYDKVLYNSTTSTVIVTGEAVLGIRANLIGRSFLIFLAKPLGETGMPIDMFSHYSGGYRASGHSDSDQPLVLSKEPTTNQADPEQLVSNHSDFKQLVSSQATVSDLPPNAVGKAMVIVIQLPRLIDHIFRVLIYVVISCATIGMGVKVELEVVKEVMKKPLAPLIGLGCQYLAMPLIAYAIARLVPQESASISLGIFTCGIVPGGGASNMYSYLLGGDISLSITMTTISCIFGLAMIPLWMFTLGETFKDETIDVHIPYPKILETLAVVLLPLSVGIFLKYKFPRVAKIITKILKPTLLISVTFLLAVGIYANLYIFKMLRPMVIFAGCLLPYLGYIIGGVVALIARLPWTRIKTVAIETGVQNTGIAFMIVFISFPPPDNQLAAVAPAASAIMTPLPLLLLTFFYIFYKRHQNKKQQTNENEEGGDENGDNQQEKRNVEKMKKMGEKSKVKVNGKCLNLWERLTLTPQRKNPIDEMLNQEVVVEAGSEEEQRNLMLKNGEVSH